MKIFRRLLRFLAPALPEVAAAILLGAGTAAAGIGLLGTSAYLLASAALHPSIGALQVAIVGVRFFGLARGGLRYLERLVSHSVNFRLLAKLRVWFYRAIEPLVPAGLDEYRSGDLLARAVGDIATLENFYVRAVSPPLAALTITVGVGCFAMQYSTLVGWVLACGLALAGTLPPLLTYSLTRRYARAAASLRENLTAVLLDAIQSLSEIRMFGQSRRTRADLSCSSRDLESALQQQARAGALGAALSGLVNHLTLWAILVVAIPLVRAGSLDGVSLAVLALLTMASFEVVLPLTQAAQHLESSLVSARRLFSVTDTPLPVALHGPPHRAACRMDLLICGLTFAYRPGGSPVVAGFDLDLPFGKRVALVGPNGAGKSTVAALLLRLWDCPPASIWLDGEDIRAYEADDVRKQIGLVPQHGYIFSGSLRQNLAVVCPQAAESALFAALAAAGLDGLLQRLPAGLDTWLGNSGEQLSGGERQRLALARAFLQNPDLLLLDEPGAGLDPSSAAQLMERVRSWNPGHSLILITHHLPGLEWLDEILVMERGRVTERGSHAQLIELDGWYARALKLQQRVIGIDELP